jgi:hypothetical protein
MNQTQRNIIDSIMHHARRDIWVTFQKEGVHMYPGADTILNWQQVAGTMSASWAYHTGIYSILE